MKFIPHFSITNVATAALTRIERARGFLEAATLSEDVTKRTLQRDLTDMEIKGVVYRMGDTNNLLYAYKLEHKTDAE